MTPRILYLSFNDGSDMRVNKELHTLGRAARVSLVAVGPSLSQHYAVDSVHTLHFVTGNRRSAGTLLRYFFTCARLLLTRRYDSVHIINEPQLLALWPLFWFQKRVVLDLFDSIFLRKNRPGNRSQWLKRLVYAPVDCTIVTDQNRLGLLPDFLKKQALVVPNYPDELPDPPRKVRSSHLTLMYFGWLGELRGTETARELLAADPNLHLLMAGWLADGTSRALAQHPRVTWLGVLSQDEAMRIAAEQADYILCVYAPTNDNNINASPNKIYDAIQTDTPVIINAEVKVSDFVRMNKIGYVLDRYRPADYISLGKALWAQRESYKFDVSLRKQYTWKNAEPPLLTAHGL